MGLTLRIGRLVLHGVTPAEAASLQPALRQELARLASAGGLQAAAAANIHGGTLNAVTPAGQGREAAGRIMAQLRPPGRTISQLRRPS